MFEELKLHISCKDNKVLHLSLELINNVEYFKEIISDLKPNDQIEFPFSEKSINVLVEFLNHFKDIPFPIIERPLRVPLKAALKDEFLFNLLSKSSQDLAEIIDLGNYIRFQPLFDAASVAFASKIIWKNPEEIRKEFNITNDLNQEDNEKINEFFDWVPELFSR